LTTSQKFIIKDAHLVHRLICGPKTLGYQMLYALVSAIFRDPH